MSEPNEDSLMDSKNFSKWIENMESYSDVDVLEAKAESREFEQPLAISTGKIPFAKLLDIDLENVSPILKKVAVTKT